MQNMSSNPVVWETPQLQKAVIAVAAVAPVAVAVVAVVAAAVVAVGAVGAVVAVDVSITPQIQISVQHASKMCCHRYL